MARSGSYWRTNLMRDLGIQPSYRKYDPDDPSYFDESVNSPESLFHSYIEPKIYEELQQLIAEEEQ